MDLLLARGNVMVAFKSFHLKTWRLSRFRVRTTSDAIRLPLDLGLFRPLHSIMSSRRQTFFAIAILSILTSIAIQIFSTEPQKRTRPVPEANKSEPKHTGIAQWLANPNHFSLCQLQADSPDDLEHCESVQWRHRTTRDELVCWPREGGFWVTLLTVAQMEDLGGDISKNLTRSEDQDEEDTFCQRTKLLGTKITHYPSADSYIVDKYGLEERFKAMGRTLPVRLTKTVLPEKGICWPMTGGVWALDDKDFTTEISAKLKATASMEERCKVIRSNGGRYYGDSRICPQLRDRMPH